MGAKTARMPLIEICVEGIDGLLAAQEAGADRVELCASLVEGGITPSFGTVREALRLEGRGGALRAGFLHYTTAEEVDRFADALEALVADGRP